MSESLDTLAERIEGMRSAQTETNDLIREHIAEDRSAFDGIRRSLGHVESAVREEIARREGHAQAIARLEATRVTREQFEPVRLIVYGFATVVGVAIAGAIVALVVK